MLGVLPPWKSTSFVVRRVWVEGAHMKVGDYQSMKFRCPQRHNPASRLVSATLQAILIILSTLARALEDGKKPPVCPLSDSQTQKSIEAFSKIAHFLTHEPRCFNCHGGVNPYMDGAGKDPEDANAPPSLTEH